MTLMSLIDACGDKFWMLTRNPIDGKPTWFAYAPEMDSVPDDDTPMGDTPEEAVGQLLELIHAGRV